MHVATNAGGSSDALPPFAIHTVSSDEPDLHNSTIGFVTGFGIEFRVKRLRVSPELRYIRWMTKTFRDPDNLFHSKVNQAHFLLGISF
jgi:hypothetical protein